MGGMAAIRRLRENVSLLQRQLSDGTLLRPLLERHEDDIYELQVIQLFEGKASSGEDMRPYYSEDLKPEGWFPSKESAMRYALWKKTGISYPVDVQRNTDAPNLYINGKFHSELEVRAGSRDIGVYPKSSYAAGIMAKYGMDKFGLTSERWRKVLEESKDRILQLMKEELYE